jgi:hypothetical protein
MGLRLDGCGATRQLVPKQDLLPSRRSLDRRNREPPAFTRRAGAVDNLASEVLLGRSYGSAVAVPRPQRLRRLVGLAGRASLGVAANGTLRHIPPAPEAPSCR